MMVAPRAVVDDAVHHRFLFVQDGHEAELVYRRVGRRLVLVHTGVPDVLSGCGIGGSLVKAAVDQARSEDLTLVPYCPFAAKWLRDHPDAVAGLTIDWATDQSLEDLGLG